MDGKVRVVEVNIKGKTYIHPVSPLEALSPISDFDLGLILKTPHKEQIWENNVTEMYKSCFNDYLDWNVTTKYVFEAYISIYSFYWNDS